MSKENEIFAGIIALFFGFYILFQQVTGALPVGLSVMAFGLYLILKNIS